MLEILGLLAGVLSAFSYLPYIRDILRGKTKPERASWLIWLVLTAMGFFSNLAIGATNSLWFPGVQMVGVTIVFLLSVRYGYGGLLKRDLLVLGAASVTLFVWYFTEQPLLALYLIILIDSFGGVLTVIKSYQHPESETLSCWVITSIAAIFSIISVGTFNVFLLSYPFYVFLINFLVVLAIIVGRKFKLPRVPINY